MHSRQSGFTLLEMLVVLAIIGLVVSVGLAAMGEARLRARNAQRIEHIQTYAKATELYFVNAGAFPQAAAPTTNHCLGMNSGETCWAGSMSGDDSLVTKFSGVVNGSLPEGDPGGLGRDGYLYTCTNSSCDGYDLKFMLEGVNQSCGPGLTINPSFQSASTYCQVIKCHLGTAPQRSGGATSAYTCQ